MKLKSFILTIGLSLFALSGLLAQDKYEYATLKYEPVGRSYLIYHSDLNGMETEKGKLAENDARFDLSPLMKHLDKFVNQGWEVFYVTEYAPPPSGYFVTYHIRKKKN